MTRARSTYLTLLTVLLTPMAANADLIDLGDSTIDTESGLEWLDLTLTTSQSYNSIIGGFGGYVADGYVYATLDQLCGLWSNAGAATAGCLSGTNRLTESISQVSADLLVGLMGRTWGSSSTPNSNSQAGFFDSGQFGSGFVGLACVNAGTSALCLRNTPPAPTAERSLSWTNTSGSGTAIGNYLVRAADVPEPGILALFGIGLAGMGLARRRRKV